MFYLGVGYCDRHRLKSSQSANFKQTKQRLLELSRNPRHYANLKPAARHFYPMTLPLFLEAPSGDQLSGRDWWVVVLSDWLSKASYELIELLRTQNSFLPVSRQRKDAKVGEEYFSKVFQSLVLKEALIITIVDLLKSGGTLGRR